MRYLALPSWIASRPKQVLGAAILLLLACFNLSGIVSMGYQNLALHSLSVALVTKQPQQLAQAEAYAKQAIAYNRPIRGALTYRLGIAKVFFGMDDEAFTDFQEALQSIELSDSLVADALFRVGVFSMNRGEGAEAADYFQQLLKMDPELLPLETAAHANVYLGMILGEQSGDLILERQYLEKALALRLDELTMDRYLGLITRMREHGGEEHLQQALEMAVYASQRQPSSTWPALIRCSVHLARQELDEATTWCQRARELAPNSPHPHVWSGLVYAQQQRWEEALAEYEMAATLTTDNSWYLTLAEDARNKLSEK